MAFIKFLLKSVLYIGVILTAITFIPGIPPDVTFTEYSIVQATELPSHFKFNERLNNPEILFQKQVKGPESFASYNRELYTGTQDGYVLKITKNKLIPIARFGKKCEGFWQESQCGRPLGLKFDKMGNLYVSDAYYGIFKVDVKTRYFEKIVDSKEPIEGKKPMITNSLDIASNGDLYWSDSCSDFNIEDGLFCMLSNPSGRLIRYNASTKKNKVLVHDLGFANGVALSKDESFAMVLETSTSRITKYNIKGANAGQIEIIQEGLPGFPDNIHSDNKEGYLISLVVYADSQNPILAQSLMPYPNLRRLAARLLMLLEAPFRCLQHYYPNYFTERIIHYVGGFESIMFITPKVVTVLRMDDNGKIIDAAYGTDGKISGITSAYIHNGFLWFGSADAEYLARVPLQQAFPDLVASNQSDTLNVESTQKTWKITTTQKPTTTKQSSKMTKSKSFEKSDSKKSSVKQDL